MATEVRLAGCSGVGSLVRISTTRSPAGSTATTLRTEAA
jgi:hypothetical protein